MTLLTRVGLSLTLVAAASPGGALSAQTAAIRPARTDSGTFVIRRAGDTVATERFTRTATTLQGTVTIRNARNTSQAYEAVVAPDGSVVLIQVTVREDMDSGRVAGKVVQRARVIFRGDSAAVDDITSKGMQTRIFGTAHGAMPYLHLSFALLEQAIMRARAASPRTTQAPFFNLGGGQTLDARLSPLGGDSLAVTIGSVAFHLRVDPAGRVLGGSIPAQNVIAERTSGS
ncbi:MAG: hypothetical protein M3Q93_13470 [Gemmatimonadota bacterium]|nr:hypothetical protein [Gemmatimonadota bacterium]